jgi:hypothetical protein
VTGGDLRVDMPMSRVGRLGQPAVCVGAAPPIAPRDALDLRIGEGPKGNLSRWDGVQSRMFRAKAACFSCTIFLTSISACQEPMKAPPSGTASARSATSASATAVPIATADQVASPKVSIPTTAATTSEIRGAGSRTRAVEAVFPTRFRMIDETIGWGVAYEGPTTDSGILVRTTDGGHTWTKTRTPFRMTGIGDFAVLDAQHLGIVAPLDDDGRENGTITAAFSDDGAASWRTAKVPVARPIQAFSLHFTNARQPRLAVELQHGMNSLPLLTYDSRDGGKAFTVQPFAPSRIVWSAELAFELNQESIWVPPMLRVSRDRAGTWQDVVPPSFAPHVGCESSERSDGKKVVVSLSLPERSSTGDWLAIASCSAKGKQEQVAGIARTKDEGRSWIVGTPLVDATGEGVQVALTGPTKNHVIAVSVKQVRTSADGGLTWKSWPAPFRTDAEAALIDMQMVSERVGFVSTTPAREGCFYRTDDGGEHFTKLGCHSFARL